MGTLRPLQACPVVLAMLMQLPLSIDCLQVTSPRCRERVSDGTEIHDSGRQADVSLVLLDLETLYVQSATLRMKSSF
jgi:hypothetical protein